MGDRRLTNWLKAYLAYTAESESPEAYHKWVALSVIAGALRRRVFFDMKYFLLYPNLYVVLVGPAGRCKKSTAMRIGRGMLSDVPGINFNTDSTTRERLIVDLQHSHADGHSSMTSYSSEFGSLLTSSGMDMVVFLTDIYDCPLDWEHRSKSGGPNKIKAPYLNLIAATTPEWIGKAMPLDTVGVGLTSRVVFIFEDTPRVRPAFPDLSPEQISLRHLLIEDLRTMSTITGEYRLAPGVKEEYETWYQARIKEPNPTGDPRLNGYFERKPMHVLKIAMIVAASFSSETIIKSENLQMAFGLLEEIEPRMTSVFVNVGKNPLAVDYAEVLAAIQRTGFASFGQLLGRFKHSVDKEQMISVLETLIATGQITADAKGYKPSEQR